MLVFYGIWGNGVERVVKEYDGWIVFGVYRFVDEVVEMVKIFYVVGGFWFFVFIINVSGEMDMGKFKEDLFKYVGVGFDDVVVIILFGGLVFL